MKKLSKSILIIIIALAMTLSLFACGGDTIYNCDCDATGGTTYICKCDCAPNGGSGNSALIDVPSNAYEIAVSASLGGWTLRQTATRIIRLAESTTWENITESEFYSYSGERRRNSNANFTVTINRANEFPSWIVDDPYVVLRHNNNFYRVPIFSETLYPTVVFDGDIVTITVSETWNSVGGPEITTSTFVINGTSGAMLEFFRGTLASLRIGQVHIMFFMPLEYL